MFSLTWISGSDLISTKTINLLIVFTPLLARFVFVTDELHSAATMKTNKLVLVLSLPWISQSLAASRISFPSPSWSFLKSNALQHQHLAFSLCALCMQIFVSFSNKASTAIALTSLFFCRGRRPLFSNIKGLVSR